MEATCSYDAATLHQGIPYWPTGDPDDDGLDSDEASGVGVPPALGSGAANWRIARTDGNADGILNAQDVTPIAVHWYEQSTGYRVYAKLPGETEFHVLSDPDDAAAPLTIPRSKLYLPGHNQVDPQRPVRLEFNYGNGTTALPDGRYEYYVTAYDATTDSDGPASPHIIMDIAAGVANQPPVAKLSVNPVFAGAPAVITFDASASTDPDGSIVEYRWDFDADGVSDWSTADATVPEQSSGGEVDIITPGAPSEPGLPPATVTVTYRQGHANYLYPRVTVVDDKGATTTQSVKLGVSGWVRELMSSSIDALDPAGEVKFNVSCIEQDPSTGELVVAGHSFGIQYFGGLPEGFYFARRKASGQWESEFVMDKDTPAVAQFNEDIYAGGGKLNTYNAVHIAWAADGQPIIVSTGTLECNFAATHAVFASVRSLDDQWETEMLYAGESPPFQNPSGAGVGSIQLLGPGKFAAVGSYVIEGGVPSVRRQILLWYDNGVVTVDEPGLDPQGEPWQAVQFAPGNAGDYYLRLGNSSAHALEHNLELLRRNGLNDWEWFLVPIIGAADFQGYTFHRKVVIYHNDDFGFYVCDTFPDGLPRAWYWIRKHGNGTFETTFIGTGLNSTPMENVGSDGSNVTLFTESETVDGNYPEYYYYYFDLLEAESHTHEVICISSSADDKFMSKHAVNSDGSRRAWWVGQGHDERFIEPEEGQFLFTRVDPRT